LRRQIRIERLAMTADPETIALRATVIGGKR
jgi:hypothetical protein